MTDSQCREPVLLSSDRVHESMGVQDSAAVCQGEDLKIYIRGLR